MSSYNLTTSIARLILRSARRDGGRAKSGQLVNHNDRLMSSLQGRGGGEGSVWIRRRGRGHVEAGAEGGPRGEGEGSPRGPPASKDTPYSRKSVGRRHRLPSVAARTTDQDRGSVNGRPSSPPSRLSGRCRRTWIDTSLSQQCKLSIKELREPMFHSNYISFFGMG